MCAASERATRQAVCFQACRTALWDRCDGDLVVDIAGDSRGGALRASNQDAIGFWRIESGQVQGACVVAVADGVGGYQDGDVASLLAIHTLFSDVSQAAGSWHRRLWSGMLLANTRVYQEAIRRGVRMGTTLTAACVLGDRVYVAHVGDSRAYLIRGNETRCLTHDHTPVGDLVRMRVLSPDQARAHENRCVLNRCLGLGLFVQPDVLDHQIRKGDVLMLCSDGLWSMLPDDELASLAREHQGLRDLVAAVLERVLAHGADDDISVIAVRVERLDATSAVASRRSLWARRSLLDMATLLLKRTIERLSGRRRLCYRRKG